MYSSPSDVLLESDFAQMEQEGILSYFPVVQHPDEMWMHGDGKISSNLIEHFMPEPNDKDGLILM